MKSITIIYCLVSLFASNLYAHEGALLQNKKAVCEINFGSKQFNTKQSCRKGLTADTTKPVINLLGMLQINIERWKEYFDPRVRLDDNVDSDSSMRPLLIVLNNLPINAQGYHFCDCEGIFWTKYWVHDLSGNVSDTAYRKIICGPSTSGLNEVINIEKLITVYPNPSNGRLNFRQNEIQNEEVQVNIFDIQGKEILTQRIKGNNLQTQLIEIEYKQQGIYTLKVQVRQSIYMKELLLE